MAYVTVFAKSTTKLHEASGSDAKFHTFLKWRGYRRTGIYRPAAGWYRPAGIALLPQANLGRERYDTSEQEAGGQVISGFFDPDFRLNAASAAWRNARMSSWFRFRAPCLLCTDLQIAAKSRSLSVLRYLATSAAIDLLSSFREVRSNRCTVRRLIA